VKTVSHVIWACALLFASCASDSSARKPQSNAASGGKVRSVDDWLAETTRDNGNGYKRDANGNWVPSSNKRSPYESQGESPYAKGKYAGKEYKTGEYTKKSWWGNKDYQPKAYDGNTDGSRFMTKSRYDGSGARESGTAAKIPDPYQTGAYATGAALEAGRGPINKPSNAEADRRRELFPEPEVIDWRDQRSLTIEQSKGILGR
jgi:hypothetical protein